MANRTIISVEPALQRRWQARVQGTASAGKTYRTKTEALRAAIRQAKAAERGQVVIKGRDGRIQSERTYGADPPRSPG